MSILIEGVSIVIPCYNVEDYIDECLSSVVGQSFREIEVICVDNNSTDGTFNKLKKWELVDSRIKVISEYKAGANAARNAGLKHTTHKFIQFLDADDLLQEHKIAHQIGLLDNNQFDILVAPYCKRFLDQTEQHIMAISDVWKALFTSGLGITSANMWNRNSVLSVGGWNEDLASSQESDLMFRMITEGRAQVLIDNEPLTIIRERGSGQISQQNAGQNLRRYANLRLDICEHLRQYESAYWEREKRFFIHNVFILMMRLLKARQSDLAHHINSTILIENMRSLSLKESVLSLMMRFLFAMKFIKIKN